MSAPVPVDLGYRSGRYGGVQLWGLFLIDTAIYCGVFWSEVKEWNKVASFLFCDSSECLRQSGRRSGDAWTWKSHFVLPTTGKYWERLNKREKQFIKQCRRFDKDVLKFIPNCITGLLLSVPKSDDDDMAEIELGRNRYASGDWISTSWLSFYQLARLSGGSLTKLSLAVRNMCLVEVELEYVEDAFHKKYVMKTKLMYTNQFWNSFLWFGHCISFQSVFVWNVSLTPPSCL